MMLQWGFCRAGAEEASLGKLSTRLRAISCCVTIL